MDIGSFQDGNPMEICCKLMVSMFFPHVFPEGKLPFFRLTPSAYLLCFVKQTYEKTRGPRATSLT